MEHGNTYSPLVPFWEIALILLAETDEAVKTQLNTVTLSYVLTVVLAMY